MCSYHKCFLLTFILSSLEGCATYPQEDFYFDRLCREQSGEHIFKTVENVTSIFQMRVPEKLQGITRPPIYVQGRLVGRPYWDFGNSLWTNEYPRNFRLPVRTFLSWEEQAVAPYTNYVFESMAASDTNTKHKFVRVTSEYVLHKPCRSYQCYVETEHRTTTEYTDSIESRYGFTWEDITPSSLSDNIAGAEWRVIDLKTGEILAYARDYFLFPRYLGSEKTRVAPRVCIKPGVSMSDGAAMPIRADIFVSKVLKPPLATSKKLYE